VGNVLRLTPASASRNGTVYYATKLVLANGFDTLFQFRITGVAGTPDASGNPGGDGFAFIIQSQGATVTGPTVGYIPYSITNALVVEFDTWQNQNLGDPNGNHISLQLVGPAPDGLTEFNHSRSLASATNIPNLSDGAIHTSRIRYHQGVLEVYLDNMTTPVLASTNFVGALDANGMAFVGFAAGTGAAYEAHDVLNWSFNNGQGHTVLNRFDTAAEVSQWRFDFGGVAHTESFDALTDANGNPGSGSMKVTLSFNSVLASENKSAYTRDAFFPAGVNGAAFSSLQMDVRIAPASALDAFGNSGFFSLVIRNTDAYNYIQ